MPFEGTADRRALLDEGRAVEKELPEDRELLGEAVKVSDESTAGTSELVPRGSRARIAEALWADSDTRVLLVQLRSLSASAALLGAGCGGRVLKNRL